MCCKYVLFIMIGLVWWADGVLQTKERRSTWCEHFFCENDSPCLFTNVTNRNGTVTAFEQCICAGSYIGPRCEAKFELTAHQVSAESVSLQVRFLSTRETANSSIYVNISGNILYSLQYWSNDSNNTCAIISNVRTKSYVIRDLHADRTYFICAQSGVVEWCFPDSNSVVDSNCVIVSTYKSDGDGEYSNPVVLPVVLVIAALLLVSLIFVIFFERKHFRMIFKLRKRRRRRRKFVRRSSHQSEYDFFLTPRMSPLSKPVFRPPPSPGRPKHTISKQAHGYAAFSTRNNQTIALKTVLEYVPEDTNDDNETTVMDPPNSSFRAGDQL